MLGRVEYLGFVFNILNEVTLILLHNNFICYFDQCLVFPNDIPVAVVSPSSPFEAYRFAIQPTYTHPWTLIESLIHAKISLVFYLATDQRFDENV